MGPLAEYGNPNTQLFYALSWVDSVLTSDNDKWQRINFFALL